MEKDDGSWTCPYIPSDPWRQRLVNLKEEHIISTNLFWSQSLYLGWYHHGWSVEHNGPMHPGWAKSYGLSLHSEFKGSSELHQKDRWGGFICRAEVCSESVPLPTSHSAHQKLQTLQMLVCKYMYEHMHINLPANCRTGYTKFKPSLTNHLTVTIKSEMGCIISQRFLFSLVECHIHVVS